MSSSDSDVDTCECVAKYELLETEYGDETAVDRVRCQQCGHTWTWERELTFSDQLEIFRSSLASLRDETLRALRLR